MKKPATDRYLQITIAGETHGVHEVVADFHANPKRISWSALKHAESMVPFPSQVPWGRGTRLGVGSLLFGTLGDGGTRLGVGSLLWEKGGTRLGVGSLP